MLGTGAAIATPASGGSAAPALPVSATGSLSATPAGSATPRNSAPGAPPPAADPQLGVTAGVAALAETPQAGAAAMPAVAPSASRSAVAGTASPTAQLQPALSLLVAKGGAQRITVALHPAELGQVEVRVERSPAGAILVSLVAERPETLHALARGQDQISQALDRAGLPAENRSITFQIAPAVVSAGRGDGTSPGNSAGNLGPGDQSVGQGGGQGAGQSGGQSWQQSGGQGSATRHGAPRPAPLADQAATGTDFSAQRRARSGVDITA
jgi:hypothetical protein